MGTKAVDDAPPTEQVQRLMNLIGKPEELCPELAAYTFTRNGIEFINHPLFCSPFHSDAMNAHANMVFQNKKAAFEEAVREKKWKQAIACWIEKPYRVEYLAKYFNQIPDDQYWPILRDVWTGVENLWQYRRLIPCLFKGRTGNIRELFREDEWERWQSMPKIITIYRGCQARNRNGWSWTMDEDRARWFSRRLIGPDQRPIVRMAVVERDLAHFFTNCRREMEVVINPKLIKTHNGTHQQKKER